MLGLLLHAGLVQKYLLLRGGGVGAHSRVGTSIITFWVFRVGTYNLRWVVNRINTLLLNKK